MEDFIAKNPKQLDLCLRMIYDADVKFSIVMFENSNGKLNYRISIDEEHKVEKMLRNRYRILTS